MRRLFIVLLSLLLLSALAGFLYWSKQRPHALYLSDLRCVLHSDPMPENALGNLLLIRPQLHPLDYQTPAHLRLILSAALDQAKQQGLLSPNTLVVLPEHIGTWLLGSHEKVEFYRARSRQEVRDWLLLGNPLLAIEVLINNLDADRLDEALLRMKAERMAQDYQNLFSELARSYQVRLLAGSILLPEPSVREQRLVSAEGPLENISLLFNSDGSIDPAVFHEPWPWRAGIAPQRIEHAGKQLEVRRSWEANYPKSQITFSQQTSPELFLRGRLSWPIGGAARAIKLVPELAPQLSDQPGSHIINLWLTP